MTAGALIAVTACTGQHPLPGQAVENQQQRQDTRSLVNDQPVPHFNYSQIRQTMIDAETIASTARRRKFLLPDG